MRVPLQLGLVVSLVVGFPAAAASSDGWNEVTFEAPAPCGATCAAPPVDSVCVGCNPDGQVRDLTRQAGHDQPLLDGRPLANFCHPQLPPASYDVEDLGPAPADARAVELALEPVGDRDAVLCSFRGPDADERRADPSDTEVRWRPDAFSSNAPAPCDGGPLGCREHLHASVITGRPYRIVAFNVADPLPASGRWRWIPEAT